MILALTFLFRGQGDLLWSFIDFDDLEFNNSNIVHL